MKIKLKPTAPPKKTLLKVSAKLPVFQTQPEVDQANALAKRLALERGLLSGEDTYVARKPGDIKPQFIDSKTGKPYIPSPVKQLSTKIPHGVGLQDIKTADGAYWYEDPQTGYVVDIDPQVVFAKFGIKPKEEVSADLIKRSMAKLKSK